MEASLWNSIRRKKTWIGYGIWTLVLTVFYAAVCTPINLWLTSDILILQTVIPLLWDVLLNLVNFLFYWISFAYLLFLFVTWGTKGQKPFFILYGGVVVFRYCANLLASFCVVGFPKWGAFWSDFFPYLLIDIGMDLLQMLIAALVVARFLQNRDAKKDTLPFQGLWDRSNRLQGTAGWLALIPSALMLISRVIYDISLGGAAGLGDLLWMITYYASDIVSIFVGYFVILLLVNRFYLREETAKADFESA